MITDESQRVAACINQTRLCGLLDQLARFGGLPGGGVNRQALSAEERDARAWLLALAGTLNCQVYTDSCANLFIRRSGRRNLPPITTGSHIDTQPCGGNLDGCYGVMAGIECLMALNDAGIVTERPVEVAIWMNEEGSRFTPGAMGSSTFIHPPRLADYLEVVDAGGISVRQELEAIRQRFPNLPPRPDDGIAAFIELHIEQGPVLEETGLPLAVVEGIQGVRWYQVNCRGESSHAGTTPMASRRDAMRLARTLADRIEHAIAHVPKDELRLTFGRWEVIPNAINTVAASVSFTLDFRHPDPAVLACLDRFMAQIITDDVTVDVLLSQSPVDFNERLRNLLMNSSRALAIPFTTLRSGAFHDAMHLAGYCPSCMLFVPSHKGISHNPAEYTDPRSLRLGAQVLACALTELACLSKGVFL